MKPSTYRGATAATTLLLAVGTAATLFAQTSPTQQERTQNPNQNPSRQTQPGLKDFDSKEFDRIANAYRELHQVTLSTLQQEARDWKESKSIGDPNRGTGDANRGTTGTTGTTGDTAGSLSGSQMSLRGDELLIAACPEGLLAGAPTSGTMSKSDMRPAGTDGRPAGTDGDNQGTSQGSTQDRTASASGSLLEGQTVGMLLVCAHSTSATAGLEPSTRKGENEPREATGDRDATTRNASASLMGPLKPGAYCVKQSGNSVWLTDEQGQTVLRTMLDKHPGIGTGLGDVRHDRDVNDGRDVSGRDAAGSDKDRTGQRDASLALAGTPGNWEHIFGAIAKEAMHSMGWADKGAPASMR